MCIKFATLTGQFDHLLKWPVRVKLTIELGVRISLKLLQKTTEGVCP